MPTLDDALDQALGKPVSNPLITIDHTQKVFTLPQDFGKAGVRGDDNGRRIYFQMPYEMDEIAPYSEHTTVEIQYKNAIGETGRYQVPKSEVMDNTNRNYTCSFPIPATLTKYEGEAEIQLCLRTDDGKKEWHISPVKVLIGPFFDCEVITEDDPKYDIVAQLMDKVTRLESVITGDEQISLANYLTKSEAEKTYLNASDAYRIYATNDWVVDNYYSASAIDEKLSEIGTVGSSGNWFKKAEEMTIPLLTREAIFVPKRGEMIGKSYDVTITSGGSTTNKTLSLEGDSYWIAFKLLPDIKIDGATPASLSVLVSICGDPSYGDVGNGFVIGIEETDEPTDLMLKGFPEGTLFLR